MLSKKKMIRLSKLWRPDQTWWCSNRSKETEQSKQYSIRKRSSNKYRRTRWKNTQRSSTSKSKITMSLILVIYLMMKKSQMKVMMMNWLPSRKVSWPSGISHVICKSGLESKTSFLWNMAYNFSHMTIQIMNIWKRISVKCLKKRDFTTQQKLCW